MRGHTVTVAMLEVATATKMGSRRRVCSTMLTANSAPAAGTSYTAARPAPAAPPSSMRCCGTGMEPARTRTSVMTAASIRGACSRPRDAPEPTASICRRASMTMGRPCNGRAARIESSSAGMDTLRRSSHHPKPAAAQPIAEPNSLRSGEAALTLISSGPWV